MLQTKVRVSKIKGIYIGECSDIQFGNVIRVNGEIIRGNEFQSDIEPLVELCKEIKTPKMMINNLTGESITPEKYANNCNEKHNYSTYYTYSYTLLETLEYKVSSRPLKLPEFIQSVGFETGDIHNPLAYFNERVVIHQAIIRTLQKRGFTQVDHSTKRPMTYFCYDHDELSFYITLSNKDEACLRYKVSKYQKTLGEILESEVKVEELYSRIEKEVVLKTSEREFNFNSIYHIMDKLQKIEERISEVEPMSKSGSKYREALGSVRELISGLNKYNEKDLANAWEESENERKLNAVEDPNS